MSPIQKRDVYQFLALPAPLSIKNVEATGIKNKRTCMSFTHAKWLHTSNKRRSVGSSAFKHS